MRTLGSRQLRPLSLVWAFSAVLGCGDSALTPEMRLVATQFVRALQSGDTALLQSLTIAERAETIGRDLPDRTDERLQVPVDAPTIEVVAILATEVDLLMRSSHSSGDQELGVRVIVTRAQVPKVRHYELVPDLWPP